MPLKQRVRRHNGRDRPQPSTAQPTRSYGESATIVIGQMQASTPQLATKHTILCEQITNDFSFLAVQPASQKREQQLQSGGVDHGGVYNTGRKLWRVCIDPATGHYALVRRNEAYAHTETWAQALREYGFACDAAQVRPLVGMGGDKLLPKIADIDEDSTEGRAITKRKKALFTERLPYLAPTPGARALIAHLQRSKKDVIVATSADDHEMRALFEQAGVADLIPRRTSKDDAPHSNPDPDLVQSEAIGRMRTLLARSRFLMIPPLCSSTRRIDRCTLVTRSSPFGRED